MGAGTDEKWYDLTDFVAAFTLLSHCGVFFPQLRYVGEGDITTQHSGENR